MQICVRTPSQPGGVSTKEWVIIEIQGDLESRVGDLEMANKFIGDLHYTKAGVPIFIIGHHILYGKILAMEKPFVAIKKMVQENEMEVDGDSTSAVEYVVQAIIKKKLLFKTRPKPIIATMPQKS